MVRDARGTRRDAAPSLRFLLNRLPMVTGFTAAKGSLDCREIFQKTVTLHKYDIDCCVFIF